MCCAVKHEKYYIYFSFFFLSLVNNILNMGAREPECIINKEGWVLSAVEAALVEESHTHPSPSQFRPLPRPEILYYLADVYLRLLYARVRLINFACIAPGGWMDGWMDGE